MAATAAGDRATAPTATAACRVRFPSRQMFVYATMDLLPCYSGLYRGIKQWLTPAVLLCMLCWQHLMLRHIQQPLALHASDTTATAA